MYKILLACGAGASSGFMASSMRKAAKKKGIEAEIKAVADAEIYNYISDYQILLLGSHYAYKADEVKEKIQSQFGNKPVVVIDKLSYSRLDGEAVLNAAIETLNK